MIDFRDWQAKFEFWYAKNFIKLEKHYTFFWDVNAANGTYAVKLLKKYDGVIFEIGDMTIGQNNEMNFGYDVIANPNNHKIKTKKFDRFILSVIRSIIAQAVENAKRIQNESGIFDLVELDPEREIHEEGTAVHEERVPERKPRKKTVRRNKDIHPQV